MDAVLSDKAMLCREKGVALTISTELPAELPIESTHLCSIFSNLLDNSIQGVLNSDTAQKQIELPSIGPWELPDNPLHQPCKKARSESKA